MKPELTDEMVAGTNKQQPPLSIRVPDGVRSILQSEADKNVRSLGAEIRFRLEASLLNEDAAQDALEQLQAQIRLLIARTQPAVDDEFEAAWTARVGDSPVGADYKHWARFGWDAAKKKSAP